MDVRTGSWDFAWTMRLAFSCLLSVSLVLSSFACSSTLRVGAVDAHPNVNLPKAKETFALRLGARVQDAYTVPRENGVGPTEVSAWKASLVAGFRNAFSDSFPTAMDTGDLVLEIQEAQIAMVPAAVSADGHVVSGRGQLRFKAQVLDKDGKTIATMSGTAESKTTTSDMSGAASLARSAIETMYEGIAAKMFSH